MKNHSLQQVLKVFIIVLLLVLLLVRLENFISNLQFFLAQGGPTLPANIVISSVEIVIVLISVVLAAIGSFKSVSKVPLRLIGLHLYLSLNALPSLVMKFIGGIFYTNVPRFSYSSLPFLFIIYGLYVLLIIIATVLFYVFLIKNKNKTLSEKTTLNLTISFGVVSLFSFVMSALYIQIFPEMFFLLNFDLLQALRIFTTTLGIVYLITAVSCLYILIAREVPEYNHYPVNKSKIGPDPHGHDYYGDEQAALHSASRSAFTGSTLGLVWLQIWTSFVLVITLFITLPYMIVIRQKWIVTNTFIDGRRLYFTGRGHMLFGKWIVWFLLGLVTLGIYFIFVPIKFKKWTVSQTHFMN